jgi:uncharacterized membrane protein
MVSMAATCGERTRVGAAAAELVEGVDRPRSQRGFSLGKGVRRWLTGSSRRWFGGLSRAQVFHKLGPVIVLLLLVTAYAVFYGMWSVRKYVALNAPAFDMGIFDQGVWLLSRFKDPFVTILGLNLFGDHLCFTMLAFVPMYWIWPGPETLLVVQAMVLAVGAIPVFLLAARALENRWFATVPAFAYLLTPALGWLNLENFHPDSLEVPLVLFALYFATRGRWRWYFAMVIPLMLVKEETVLFLVPLGIYVALRHSIRMGLLTVGLSIVWFVVGFFGIQPALSGASAGALDSWRIPFGGLGGLVKTTFQRPWDVIAYMLTAEKIQYMFQLLTPLLFLPLLTWRSLMALPVLLYNLISNFWYQSNLQYHYHSMLTPVLWATGLLALERFRRVSLRRAVITVVLLMTLFSAYMWGPLPSSRQPSYYPDPGHPDAVAAAEAFALIPDDAAVSAIDKFAAHLATRELIYVFPNPYSASYWGDFSLKGVRLPGAEKVEYVMAMPALLEEEAAVVWAGLPDEGFRPIYDRQGIVLLHREALAEPPGVLTEEWARSTLRVSHDTTTP